MQRGTRKNRKSQGLKKRSDLELEKAFRQTLAMHFENCITFHKKATQVENAVLKKAISVHMSIICNSLLIKRGSTTIPFPHGNIDTSKRAKVQPLGYYTMVRRGRYVASIYKYR